MTEWTSEAKRERDAFLTRQREAFTGSDIDADEVIDDIRRHIDEELKGLEIITQEDVKRVIRHLGVANEAVATPTPSPEAPPQKNGRKLPGAGLLVIGVILPFISLVFELFSHACAGAFFDPIPTWWHVALVSIVPFANVLAITRIRSGNKLASPTLIGLNSAALVVATFYSIAFAPLCIPGLIAVFYFGFGLLPMGPLFGLIGTWLCRRHLIACGNLAPRQRRSFSLAGGLTILAAFLLLELPNTTTRIALEYADAESLATQNAGIRFLRRFGSEDTMLRACYERPRKWTNLAAMVISTDNPVTQTDARKIFFRATGKPFNTKRPPQLYTRGGRWEAFDDLTWDFDEAQGGSSVAGRVRGLFMTGSRMDCRVHSQAGLAYLEWTFEFSNQSNRQREARTQILLPPEAVVSRLTLWVNGEEREAAFAGRAEVREAYENIVRQRRDPVLVTTAGKDRILMQCFPVPPEGGTMKTRLGITIPLSMLSAEEGKLALPKMVERNFNLLPDLEHAIWIESRSSLSSQLTGLTAGSKEEGEKTLHGQIIDSELQSPESTIHITRPEPTLKVWARGVRNNDTIVQNLTATSGINPDRLSIVVDGSWGMQSHYPAIADALEALPNGVQLNLFHATDIGSDTDARTASASPVSKAEAATRLRNMSAEGGQNNLKWLVRAWDIAASGENGAVLWIHGPQPVSLSSDQALKQRIERSPQRPQIFEIQTSPGPNRLLEDLGIIPIKRIQRFGSIDQDLTRWFEGLLPEESHWTFDRERRSKNAQAELDGVPEVTDHVSRLWARTFVEALAQQRDTAAAIQLSQHNQLVTSVSGAVVLETQEQFENAGLNPVDVSTVPVIPEPEPWKLILFGGLLLLISKKLFKLARNRKHGH